jgi:hypothetical protein
LYQGYENQGRHTDIEGQVNDGIYIELQHLSDEETDENSKERWGDDINDPGHNKKIIYDTALQRLFVGVESAT